VLAGGASSRMGRNKALLAVGGRTLLEIAVRAVAGVAGKVTIIGPPGLYEATGVRVIGDLRAGAGPLGGIETALADSVDGWNLVVACDMPRLADGGLRRILQEAWVNADAGCVIPESGDGQAEPLCAAYHRRMLPVVRAALDAGTRKVTDALPAGLVRYIRMTDDPIFQNVNTPEEWGAVRRDLEH